MHPLIKIALGIGAALVGSQVVKSTKKSVTSSTRLAKYQTTLMKLPRDPAPFKTIDKILNEINPNDKQTFADLLRFHAKEAAKKSNIPASSLYSSLAKYVEAS